MAAMKDHQAGIAALPRAASLLAIPSVLKTGMALMDLTRIPDEVIAGLKAEYTDAAGVIVLGCGLEPGLTEIMARHLAERLDRTDELHIQCGGIPANPQPPLSYKIVFGGTHLPFHETDARVVENGILKPVPRYSDAEPTTFGIKLAGHYAEFKRNRDRLAAAREEVETEGPNNFFKL